MLIAVDPTSPRPLYEQIAAAIRRGIAEGTVRDGERLPPARQLASSLEVNMHTVLRAYADLRDEGLLHLRQGRGAVVRGGAGAAHLHDLARALLTEGRRQGLSVDDLAGLLRRLA